MGPPFKRRLTARLIPIVLWTATAGALLPLLAAWLTPARLHDHGRLFTAWSFAAFMIRTFTFQAALGLLLTALLALLLRHRYAAATAGLPAALIIAACCVRSPRAAPPPPGAHTLTVLTHNLLFINNNPQPTLDLIAAENPDLILFQEYTPAMHASLSPALAANYPYQAHAFRDNSYGEAVYSRRPFLGNPLYTTDATSPDGAPFRTGNGPQYTVRIDLAGTPITIHNVHTDAPGSLALYRSQRRQFQHLAALAAADDGPAVFAGDFNATCASQHLAALEDAGLADALDAPALGRHCTWCDRTVLQWLPGIRIDHILHSRQLACAAAHVGAPTGSDHRPVIATLYLRNK
ncbi:MAG: endonuclease/exonuclease/phosphatase family protein [Phycisphaerales bacterium]